MLMSRQALLDICKEHRLYRTPSLNDKLYCNFKGFTNVAGLEEYTALRALFLEGNALDSLEGMPPLKELRCLYVQQNNLFEISSLDRLENLDTLNVSNNQIRRLENLSCCKKLSTLICTHNKLESVESIAHLAECTGLHTLDLQNNNLNDPAVLDILKRLPEIKCLYLKGNPVVSMIKNYRKTVIAALPSLTYLDDRPVFEQERRLVQAWVRGGVEAEREERNLIRKEEEEAHARNFEAMQQIRREGWRKRRERLGLADGESDPALDDLSDDEYEFTIEPPELVEARQRLAAYMARPGEEEPPELAEARMNASREGRTVAQGSWGHDSATEAPADGTVYLESVKQAQKELNMAGQAVQHGKPAQSSGAAEAELDESASSAVHKHPGQQGTVTPEAEPSMPGLELVGDVDLSELD